MPRVNLGRATPDKLSVLVKGYFPTGAALARVLYCSQPTGKRKLSNPDLLTRADLRRLVKSGIPAEDMREAML